MKNNHYYEFAVGLIGAILCLIALLIITKVGK